MSTRPLSGTLWMNLPMTDVEIIEEIARTERRRATDVIRNVIEDLVEGKIRLKVESVGSKKRTSVRVEDALLKKVNAFKEATGMTIDQALHLALMRLREDHNTLHEPRATYNVTRQ